MKISNINNNQVYFKADNSNNKSNAGKYIGLGIGLGLLLENGSRKGGFKKFLTGYYDNFAKQLEDEITKNGGKKVEIKELTSPMFKRMAKINMISSVAFTILSGFVCGAIVDFFINAFSGTNEHKRI